MNELTSVPSKKPTSNPFNKNIILLFLFLIPILKPILKKSSIEKKSMNNFLTSISSSDFQEKVDIIKKAGPYLPESIINIINLFVPLYEKVAKVMGLVNFMKNTNSFTPIVPEKNLNNKERINKVMSLVEKELPEDKTKQVKPLMELMGNMDKLKTIMNMVSNMTNTEKKSENQMENIFNLLGPLLGGKDGKDDKNMDKMKEMFKMVELLNVLNTSDKKEKATDEDTRENNKE